MANDKICEEIIQTCLYMSRERYFNGTWGNISVRVDAGMLITPSRINYQEMTSDDLVLLSIEDGSVLKGSRIPSSEKELHRLILKNRPEFNAVVHFHSPWATAVAVQHKTIPVLTEEMAQIIGGPVQTSKYVPGGHHIEFAQAVYDAMGTTTAAIAANHGAVACGVNLTEAVAAVEVLEKSAQLFIFGELSGTLYPLSDEVVLEERNRFLYKYGKE